MNSIFEQLLRIYDEVEAAVGGRTSCSACGRCCDFSANDYVLFASQLEIDLLTEFANRPPELVNGRCCYQSEDGRCTVHQWRPLGCRTYFCRSAMQSCGEEFLRETYENALQRIRELCRANRLPWQYKPVF